MTRARNHALRILRLMMVCSLALPAVLFAYASWIGHRSLSAAVDERIDRALDVLQEQTLKVLQSVELAISTADELMRGMSDADIRASEERLHQRLRAIVAPLSQVRSLWVFDRDGRPLAASSVLPVPPTIDNATRDYFQAQLRPNAELYIGEVIALRAGGSPTFTASRRRSAADGTFDGVIAVALNSDEFYHFYEQIGQAPGSYLALMRADGVFLARYPAAPQPGARLDRTSTILNMIEVEPFRGIFDVRSQLDGIDRRIGYRKVGKYPVYILAGLERAAINNEWWTTMSSHLIFGVPSTLLLFAVLTLALRRTQRLYAEADARAAAEDALRQAQKMESIGQLTGGVAHDFNNLLTVVIGNLELADRMIEAAPTDNVARVRRYIENAMQGAHRAATLTQRLLAFARRQPLKPEPVNSNALIRGMADLLRGSLGESIQIDILPTAGLWLVEADPVQLESAILNLAVNARDAMPNGGRLVIETGNVTLDENYCRQHRDVPPGPYVVICVRDNGSGIPSDVAARAFEPFFTTKPAGQGTGLGLSQVYGFVKQSGGHVTLDSRPGHGTTVRIYLPRLSAAKTTETAGHEAETPLARGETVLVVEDDEPVRRYIVEVLTELNYVVLEAADAETALQTIAAPDQSIDLLLTDVVLPGINGRELAAHAQSRHPGIRVLFMTGYSRDAIVHQGKLDPDIELLQKPITRASLAGRLRDVLDRQAAPGLAPGARAAAGGAKSLQGAGPGG